MNKIMMISIILLFLYSGISCHFVSEKSKETCTLETIRIWKNNFNTCLYGNYFFQDKKIAHNSIKRLVLNLQRCFDNVRGLECKIKHWKMLKFVYNDLLPVIKTYVNGFFESVGQGFERTLMQKRCVHSIDISYIKSCLPSLFYYNHVIKDNKQNLLASWYYYSNALSCIINKLSYCPNTLKSIITKILMEIGQKNNKHVNNYQSDFVRKIEITSNQSENRTSLSSYFYNPFNENSVLTEINYNRKSSVRNDTIQYKHPSFKMNPNISPNSKLRPFDPNSILKDLFVNYRRNKNSFRNKNKFDSHMNERRQNPFSIQKLLRIWINYYAAPAQYSRDKPKSYVTRTPTDLQFYLVPRTFVRYTDFMPYKTRGPLIKSTLPTIPVRSTRITDFMPFRTRNQQDGPLKDLSSTTEYTPVFVPQVVTEDDQIPITGDNTFVFPTTSETTEWIEADTTTVDSEKDTSVIQETKFTLTSSESTVTETELTNTDFATTTPESDTTSLTKKETPTSSESTVIDTGLSGTDFTTSVLEKDTSLPTTRETTRIPTSTELIETAFTTLSTEKDTTSMTTQGSTLTTSPESTITSTELTDDDFTTIASDKNNSSLTIHETRLAPTSSEDTVTGTELTEVANFTTIVSENDTFPLTTQESTLMPTSSERIGTSTELTDFTSIDSERDNSSMITQDTALTPTSSESVVTDRGATDAASTTIALAKDDSSMITQKTALTSSESTVTSIEVTDTSSIRTPETTSAETIAESTELTDTDSLATTAEKDTSMMTQEQTVTTTSSESMLTNIEVADTYSSTISPEKATSLIPTTETILITTSPESKATDFNVELTDVDSTTTVKEKGTSVITQEQETTSSSESIITNTDSNTIATEEDTTSMMMEATSFEDTTYLTIATPGEDTSLGNVLIPATTSGKRILSINTKRPVSGIVKDKPFENVNANTEVREVKNLTTVELKIDSKTQPDIENNLEISGDIMEHIEALPSLKGSYAKDSVTIFDNYVTNKQLPNYLNDTKRSSRFISKSLEELFASFTEYSIPSYETTTDYLYKEKDKKKRKKREALIMSNDETEVAMTQHIPQKVTKDQPISQNYLYSTQIQNAGSSKRGFFTRMVQHPMKKGRDLLFRFYNSPLVQLLFDGRVKPSKSEISDLYKTDKLISKLKQQQRKILSGKEMQTIIPHPSLICNCIELLVKCRCSSSKSEIRNL